MNHIETREGVKEYYGKVLQSTADLKTNACCPAGGLPPRLRKIANKIHPAVQEKFYGCGSPIPEALSGLTVLDLGCGTGRDCFILSSLVGEQGRVIGVDMTEEQLKVGRAHVGYHRDAFGHRVSNVELHHGYIEDLKAIGLEDDSVDVVISNCVLNLCPDKKQAFSEIFRVLKPGGELYFSDVFAMSRIPEELTKDKVLVGECLAGAMYIEDFRRLLLELGCPDYRVVENRRLNVGRAELRQKLGQIVFCTMTIRVFKLASLEDRCENYGQQVTYLGSLAECSEVFQLDSEHEFQKGTPVQVCGNTAAMIAETRLAFHFQVTGDRSQHFGLFYCSPAARTKFAEGSCC